MENFTLPSGKEISLRGLSGFEVMVARKAYPEDNMLCSAVMLGFSMDAKDVKEAERIGLDFMKTHLAGDLGVVIDKFQELSGLSEGATKSSV